MQTEKKKNSQGSPDTDVIWASPPGGGTRNQAHKGCGAFSIGHVLSSWLFHRLKCTLGTRDFFSSAAEIFGVDGRPKPQVAKPEKAPEKSLPPRVNKILKE